MHYSSSIHMSSQQGVKLTAGHVGEVYINVGESTHVSQTSTPYGNTITIQNGNTTTTINNSYPSKITVNRHAPKAASDQHQPNATHAGPGAATYTHTAFWRR